MKYSDSVATFLGNEFSSLRKKLADDAGSIERVADYCDKLNNTKNSNIIPTKDYAIQSLASVAYQINVISAKLLNCLEMQELFLEEIATNVKKMSTSLAIKEEKAARREIGALTVSKPFPKQPLFIKPNLPEKSIRYIRKAISYTTLDDIGHGVKFPQYKHTRPSGSINKSSYQVNFRNATTNNVSMNQQVFRSNTCIASDYASKEDFYNTYDVRNPRRANRYGLPALNRECSLVRDSIYEHGEMICNPKTEPSWAPSFYIEKVIAIYDYEKQRDDELSFGENAIIYVVKKNNDGWFEGVMEPGIRGLFPGNYVEYMLAN